MTRRAKNPGNCALGSKMRKTQHFRASNSTHFLTPQAPNFLYGFFAMRDLGVPWSYSGHRFARLFLSKLSRCCRGQFGGLYFARLGLILHERA